MRPSLAPAAALALLALGAGAARADCASSLARLEAQVAKQPLTGDQKTLKKELAKAHEDLALWAEGECVNDVIRARRAFEAPAKATDLPRKGPVQPLYQR